MSSEEGDAAPEQQQEERRLRKRYEVSTLAEYRWQDSSGTWFSDTGTTLNISVGGVYVLTVSSPPSGAPIEMKVAVLGPGRATGRGYLFGRGVVTRVNSEAGFAARVGLRMLRNKGSDWNPAE